jgi:LuxR family maltose regulon positive regulatory protein
MTTMLLSTKLNIPPPRPDLVPRQRLVERLNEAISRKLLLISAPAGFGKTTLLSSWVKESRLPAAWLSLDADDNDPTRFIAYIATALGGIDPEVGQTSLALLQSMQAAPLKNVLTMLINELSSIPHDFFLLLDDYHLIDAQEVHKMLTYLIDHLPQKMHLVLASRSDPPLPLSRLRARNQLMEMRQAELRFTPQEAVVFLKQSIGIDLTMEQAAALETRTEGWIAGLQLAAISLQGKDDISTFIQAFSGSHYFIIDYLAEEVLSQQPKDLRRFLQQTSVLERFTAPFCEALTGREDSASLLKRLEDANLFIIPLDDHREWYRYHHLLRDFLRTELDEGSRITLQQKASRWLTSKGLYAEGVKHALACGDTEEAARAISLAAPGMFNQASFSTLLAWLNALPEETVQGSSTLAIHKSFALLLTHSFEEARPYVKAAERSISPETTASTRGQLLSLQAHMALYAGGTEDCIQLSRDALEELDDHDLVFRNLTLNVLGQVLEIKGDVASATDIYRQAFKSGWQREDQLGSLVTFTNLVFALNELGRRVEAVALCEQLVAQRVPRKVQGLSTLDAVYLSWSLLSLEANELDIACEQIQRAMDIISAANVSQGISWGLYILARIHLAEGEFDAMFKLTHEGRQLASQMGHEYIHGAWFAALEAQANLQQENLDEAQRWAEKTKLAPRDMTHHWMDHPHFTYIRLLLAQDRTAEAQVLLNKMEKAAQAGGRLRKLITSHLLHARLQLAQGEMGQALTRIENALKLAAPQGYRRAFLDEGQKIVKLLPRVREVTPGFVDELLTFTHTEAAPGHPAEVLIDPLSERELEVLRLVAGGLSNREIAEALFITLGTVKKHLNNIFSKLNVKSRTQAAIRGRELGLLK